MQPVYVTTAIPYVNAQPHVGFALELVLADALARSYRGLGHDVRLCTGSDENSLKNVLAARAAGSEVAPFVATQATQFEALANVLGLAVDDFVRTSVDARHRLAVDTLWRRCVASGDVYQGHYEGWYCVGCEAFVGERDLVDGGCAEHTAPLQWLRERNYFFRLSRHADALRELIATGRLLIRPSHRRNEVIAMIDAGLQDFCISRPRERTEGWGIPVPGDPDHVIYVWFDALVNYLSGLGFPHGELFARYWERGRVVHVIGKGIVRFHALYWPAMLLSAGVRVPDELWVHGYATLEGEKISKSSATSLAPDAAAALDGIDALRWYLLAHIGSDDDGDFSTSALRHAYVRELADTFGNLASRVLGMLQRWYNGAVPTATSDPDEEDIRLRARAARIAGDVQRALQQDDARSAAQLPLRYAQALNAFVSARAPWALARDPAQREQLDDCLVTLVVGLRALAEALVPIAPQLADALASRVQGDVLEPGPPLVPKPEADQ